MISGEIKLKDGAVLAAGEVIGTLDALRGILRGAPDGEKLIEELLTWCESGRDHVSARTIEFFSPWVLMIDSETGAPLPHIGVILRLAFKRVPDGVVLINPYTDDAEIANAVDAQRDREKALLDKLLKVGNRLSEGRIGPR